jgi:3-carboxy-cis,cis-muconate cycloisomerase
MSIAAIDHPFLCGLVGDDETAALFSAEADIAAMLAFEAALAEACAAHGFLPRDAALQIADACGAIKTDIDGLRQATARDGVVVPELVRQLRNVVGGDFAKHVHLGATSQDVIDTSLMIRLKRACIVLEARLAALTDGLDALASRVTGGVLMGHTRMQPALPISSSDRIRTWRDPLVRHLDRLRTLMEAHFAIQFGGAVGTLETFGDKASDVRRHMAAALQLADAPQFHSQRDRIVEIASLLAMITGSLGKFGQDVALMAQSGAEISLSGGGGSSAMAHKQNPVAAEVLVALARFNAVQAGGMQQVMIHEQERSGAAWTLEWLILPQMVVVTGAALRLASELSEDIRRVGKSGKET